MNIISGYLRTQNVPLVLWLHDISFLQYIVCALVRAIDNIKLTPLGTHLWSVLDSLSLVYTVCVFLLLVSASCSAFVN